MALLKKWRDTAYSETANKGDLQRFWNAYFEAETEIYASLLKNPDEVVSGTVKELADKYEVSVMTMTGFLYRTVSIPTGPESPFPADM